MRQGATLTFPPQAGWLRAPPGPGNRRFPSTTAICLCRQSGPKGSPWKMSYESKSLEAKHTEARGGTHRYSKRDPADPSRLSAVSATKTGGEIRRRKRKYLRIL